VNFFVGLDALDPIPSRLIISKDGFGETPKPAPGTGALPGKLRVAEPTVFKSHLHRWIEDQSKVKRAIAKFLEPF